MYPQLLSYVVPNTSSTRSRITSRCLHRPCRSISTNSVALPAFHQCTLPFLVSSRWIRSTRFSFTVFASPAAASLLLRRACRPQSALSLFPFIPAPLSQHSQFPGGRRATECSLLIDSAPLPGGFIPASCSHCPAQVVSPSQHLTTCHPLLAFGFPVIVNFNHPRRPPP